MFYDQPVVISIHALRKESDRIHQLVKILVVISIHALRKESDDSGGFDDEYTDYFNPRSP